MEENELVVDAEYQNEEEEDEYEEDFNNDV
jgi:hypothetical protein